MLFIRIQAPSEHEVSTVLIGGLFRLHGLSYESGQFSVGLMPAFIGGVGVLGIGPYAREGNSSLALRSLFGTAFQRHFRKLRSDLWHARPLMLDHSKLSKAVEDE
jgi:hypothetical protein